jgi:2-C-methyl-D-erythritol 2,4-cyclodiphosphate synthase
MRQHIADDLGTRIDRINIKATTAEGLGAIGRAEGLACQAIVLLAHGDNARAHGQNGQNGH